MKAFESVVLPTGDTLANFIKNNNITASTLREIDDPTLPEYQASAIIWSLGQTDGFFLNAKGLPVEDGASNPKSVEQSVHKHSAILIADMKTAIMQFALFGKPPRSQYVKNYCEENIGERYLHGDWDERRLRFNTEVEGK